MAHIRAFVAIEIEPPIIDRLAALQQSLRRAGGRITWARPEGIHITLKFLGDVAEERIPAFGDVLAEIAGRYAPFRLTVAGVGAFPTMRRPRIIWAGIGDGTEELRVLGGDVERAFAGQGFPAEARPFRPHLTLGRVRDPEGIDDLMAVVQEHADDQFGQMAVRQLTLMRSDLSPKGARYTPLRRVALGG